MAKDREGQVPGAQRHAEGQHGDRTRARLVEQNATGRDRPDPTQPEGQSHREGTKRLEEDRQQHDPAEKDSERNGERR
jgi:hypothetical protein